MSMMLQIMTNKNIQNISLVNVTNEILLNFFIHALMGQLRHLPSKINDIGKINQINFSNSSFYS